MTNHYFSHPWGHSGGSSHLGQLGDLCGQLADRLGWAVQPEPAHVFGTFTQIALENLKKWLQSMGLSSPGIQPELFSLVILRLQCSKTRQDLKASTFQVFISYLLMFYWPT